MKKRIRNRHVVDLLFTLALFCVFVASALVVVIIGADIYSNTTVSMNENYRMRTSLSYIAAKIHANDTSGSVQIGDFQGEKALMLIQNTKSDTYITYIYAHENQLKELYCKEGAAVTPESGEAIMDIQNFTLTEINDNLYQFQTTDGQNEEHILYVSTHSS